MRVRIAFIIVALLLAGPSFALDSWDGPDGNVNNTLIPGGSRSFSSYTPTTTTGDTQSPTLDTTQCSGITVMVYGADLTAMVQICGVQTVFDDALSTAECRDMTLTAIDGASGHGIQIIPSPGVMRLSSITGSDGTQFVQVVCAP